MTRPRLICRGCNKQPSEIDEYIYAGQANEMTPDDYCWEEEGTLNSENGHFLCTGCYIKAGMPSTSRGWTTP